MLSKENFQKKIDGKEVNLFTLENDAGLSLQLTNFGSRMVALYAPDKEGKPDDIILGFDSIDGYLEAKERFFGAAIGRFANRIARGNFSLNNQEYSLEVNNEPNHLHGGSKGFHEAVWEVTEQEGQMIKMAYTEDHMQCGFPGKIKVQVSYSVTVHNEVVVEFTARSDRDTILNLTTHPFFNLAGGDFPSIKDHSLYLNANYFTPVDKTSIPTGEILKVKGTPFDFRKHKPIGKHIKEKDTQLERGNGYDHNFVLNKVNLNEQVLAARVYEPVSGRLMEVFTDEPGIQFYTGNFLDGSDTGKNGVSYKRRGAFCLEPQHFPNSPNISYFPSTVLKAGEIFNSQIAFKFMGI